MAKNVTDWAWEKSRAVNGSFIVLLALAREAGADGMAKISIPELAAIARLSERATRDAVRSLERSAEIRTYRKAGGHGRSGYQVIMGTPADSAALDRQNLPPEPIRSPAESAARQNLPPADSAPPRTDTAQVRAINRQILPGVEKSTMLFSSTGRSEVDPKDVSAIATPDGGAVPWREDVERLCAHLADRIEANGSKRPAITKRWRDSARRMMDIDGRTEDQVMRAIDWCQGDEFWQGNILSMPKLREKYDQLRLHATRSRKRPRSRQAETDELFDRAMKRAEQREAEIDATRNGNPDQVRQSALPGPGDR